MEVIMTLSEFLSQNPAAKIEHDKMLNDKYQAGEASAKAEIQKRIDASAKYVNSEEYPKQVRDIAVEVIKGSKSLDALEVMASTVDMFNELKKSNAAANETDTIGNTSAGTESAPSADGAIKSISDFEAEIARAKSRNGIEVK
jgi:hypothetical protein